jgi:hypothetical protein
MGFPFIAPLKKELRKKFKEREASTQKDLRTLSMPFAMLSCGAVVTQRQSGKQIKEIIHKQTWPNTSKTYYGCVISNSTDVKNNYQTGATICGYDLNGKPILVEGEKNRRVSLPIITQIEIDTDGNNNTLKTAKVDVKVFTLKQLEMFELFFLRPAMDVVLEFGYGTDIRNNSTLIDKNLFIGKGYEEWETRFIKIFSRADNAYKIAKQQYLDVLKETGYDYDYMAGKVTNFNFSPDTDGTYNITIEISSGNELQMWMPLKQASETGKISKASGTNVVPYLQWLNKLAADINLPKLINGSLGSKGKSGKYTFEKEFFNWGVINKDEKDTNYSKDSYISFRLIIEILNNSQIFTNKPKQIKAFYYEDKDLKIPIMPVSSWETIISTNPSFILPGTLPKIFVANLPNKKDEIVLDPKSFYECPINGYSFNLKTEELYNDSTNQPIKIPKYTGNLLNVFINYETFVRIFNESYTQGDIINSLLAEINSNMFGLCKLELQKEDDSVNSGALTIIDRKLKNLYNEQKEEEIYRFKIGAIDSIVKEFEFNMEMSELMQGQAMFATEYDILKIIEQGKTDNRKIVAEIEEYSSADLSFLPNADGYCSINKVGIELVREAKRWNNILTSSLDVVEEDKNDETEEEQINNHDVLKGNYIRFKSDAYNRNSDTNHMIYQDPALIQYHIPKKQKGTTVLTFLDITLAIDGTAGLSCGEYFNIDGIPEIYNKNGYFQITNIKHGLSENEWKTTIEASYLMKSDDSDLEEATIPTYSERKPISKIKTPPKSATGTTQTPAPTNTTGIGTAPIVPNRMIQDNTYVSRPTPKSLAELQRGPQATLSQIDGPNPAIVAENLALDEAKRVADLQKRLTNYKTNLGRN